MSRKLYDNTETLEEVLELLNNKAAGGGGSGEKPTLFTPSITLQSVTSVLTITDDNGGFVQGYNVYANDNLITVSTSKEVTLADYIEHTETLEIKVQAVGANFNPSDYAVATWAYVNVNGTTGIEYSISSKGYAICMGIGSAVETDIEIASIYDDYAVTTINSSAFSNANITSVYIPNTITTIRASAFQNCNSLKGVYITDIVAWCNIDYGSYSANPVYYAKNLYLNNELVTKLVIPAIVRSIKLHGLAYCDSLTSVVFEGSLAKIDSDAFNNCDNLKRIDCSNNTTIPVLVNTDAFGKTHADLQIKIPASFYDDGSWASTTNWSELASKLVKEFTNTL